MDKKSPKKLSLHKETLRSLKVKTGLQTGAGDGLRRTLAYGCVGVSEDCETKVSCDLTDRCVRL